MAFFYYCLLRRPPMPGAFPATPEFVDVVSGGGRKGMLGFGTATYQAPLSRRDIDAYEMMPLPMAYVQYRAQYPDWLLVNVFDGELFDSAEFSPTLGRIVKILADLARYFPDAGDTVTLKPVGGQLFAIPRACLAMVVEAMPEWSRWMVQFLLQGCSPERFGGLTRDGIIDESARIEESGEYGILID